jgi:hypothetical protein
MHSLLSKSTTLSHIQIFGKSWASPFFFRLVNFHPHPHALSRNAYKLAQATIHSMAAAEIRTVGTVGTEYTISSSPGDIIEEGIHHEWTQALEDNVASEECRLVDDWVKGRVVIKKDREEEPLVGYYKGVIDKEVAEMARGALLEYGKYHPLVSPITRAKRNLKTRLNTDRDKQLQPKREDKRYRGKSQRDINHGAKYVNDPFGSEYGWRKDIRTKIHLSQKTSQIQGRDFAHRQTY